jgi:hypothetical protein
MQDLRVGGREHPFAERFGAMQQSRVDYNLRIGLMDVWVAAPMGRRLDESKTCPAKWIFRMLRVMNAGCNEDFVVEPAEF